MLIEWAAISAAVVPHIKKYAGEQGAKLTKEYAGSKLGQLYKHFVPDEKLTRAVEAFLVRFDKELDSAADIPTLTVPAYREALKVFLTDPDVLETLEKPLDAESDLDWEFLRRKWTYLRDAKNDSLISLPSDFDWAKLAKRYCEAVRVQALSNPELRKVIAANASLKAAKATDESAASLKRIAGVEISFDLVRYAQSIKESFQYLRLGSLDADWAVYENRVHLENVYVPQSAKPALPPRDLTRDYLRKLESEEAEKCEKGILEQKQVYASVATIPVLKVVDERTNNRLVVLGDPGLGKSTLLKYLALRWADDSSRPITFLLELRRTMDEFGRVDFLGYIEDGRGQTSPLPRLELDKHLKNNQSLMLFDGLDEVVEDRRGDVVSRIINFTPARRIRNSSVMHSLLSLLCKTSLGPKLNVL